MLIRKYPTALLAGLLALGLMAPTGAARADGPADILPLVPSDAWGFVVIKSLKNLDDKAASLKETLGLSYETPVTPMALGMLGLAEDIDNTRPLGVVMLDVQKFGDPQKATILLIPAKDPAALLKKLAAGAAEAAEGENKDEGGGEEGAGKPAKKSGDAEEGDAAGGGEKEVTRVSVMGEPGYAAIKGKTVILGPGEEGVLKIVKAKKPMSESFAGDRAATMGQCDLFISVSMNRVLGAYKQMILPLAQMATAAQGASGKDIEMLFKMFEEMEGLDIGLAFDKKGFALRLNTTPKKGSDLAQLYSDEKNSKSPLLDMLPRQKYIFAAAATAAPSEARKKFGGGNTLSNALKMAQLGEMNEEAVKTLDQTFVQLQDSIERYGISVSLINSETEGLFGVCMVAQTASAREFTENVRKIYKTLAKVTDDEDFADALKHVKHQPDAETIAGTKVDTLTLDIDNVAKKFEAEEGEIKKVRAVLGKDCVIRFGPADEKHFVISFGGGKRQFETACGAAKSSGDLLSADAGIQAAGGDLPSPRNAEMFIAFDTAVQAFKALAKAHGEEDEMPFDLPAINAPVSIGSTVQNDISRIEILIPMKLIKAGKEAYDKYAAKAGQDDFDDEGGDAAGKAKDKKKDSAEGDEAESPKDDGGE